MADETLLVNISLFSGLNDVDEQTSLSPERDEAGHYVFPLHSTQNIIIDNKMKMRSRDGYASLVSGTSPHSLWSDGDYCFFVENERLYRLNEDWSLTTIRSWLAYGSRMSYVKFNTKLYYANGYQIGYVNLDDLSDNAIANPGVNFKLPLPPGQLIELYRTRLYVASSKILYFSDPWADHYDNRRGAFQFLATITMLRALDDGIYVAADKVYFLKGTGPDDFIVIETPGYDAIKFTDVVVHGNYLGTKESMLMWTGATGVCLGDNNGKVINIMEKRHTLLDSSIGAAIARLEAGREHYIGVLDYYDDTVNATWQDVPVATISLQGITASETI